MKRVDVLDVIASGRRAESLRALRDRLASELDEERAAEHKRECRCTCGMGDGRVIVALVKELRAVIAELDSLADGQEVSELDVIAAGVQDDLASARARRAAGLAGAADP